MTTSTIPPFSKERGLLLEKVIVRQDLLWIGGLFLLGLITRLPFTEQILYHWDSINFALGLRHFDVAAGQPHVPGYILYVALGKIVDLFTHDVQTTLVGISLLSSGLATAFLFVLGKTMFNRTVGIVAALFLAASPLYWFYGEIALPHTLDALVIIVLVWLLYRITQGETRLGIWAAVLLGIAGGLRPQTELFLAPLAVYVGWRLGWKRGLIAGLVLAAVDLAWFIPLVALNGGVARYFFVMNQFTAAFDTTTSVLSGAGWFGLRRNLEKLSMYTLYGWGLAFLPMALLSLKHFPRLREVAWPEWMRSLLHNVRFWIMVLWAVPTLVYYIFIHMGQQGLVFVYLPALLLVSAVAVTQLAWDRSTWGKAIVAGILIMNSAIYLLAPQYPLGGTSLKLLTVDTLRQHDRYYQVRMEAIPAHFSVDNTIILSSAWRFPQYYLPSYAFVPYTIVTRWEEGEGLPTEKTVDMIDPAGMGLKTDPGGSYYLILMDDDLLPYNQSAQRTEYLTLPDGEKLAFLRLNAHEKIDLNPDGFVIVQAP